MRKLPQQLEEMHIRIAETASQEETILKALDDALTRLDEQLLADVQTIANEHQARRTAILGELQSLAAGIGMFQVQRPAVTAREDIELEPYLPSAGCWREAASHIADTDDQGEAHPLPRALFPHEQRRVQAATPLSLVERRRQASGR